MSEPAVAVRHAGQGLWNDNPRAIRSVLNQTYRNWTLFVMDDGSTDDTVRRAESFKDDRIHVLGMVCSSGQPHVATDPFLLGAANTSHGSTATTSPIIRIDWSVRWHLPRSALALDVVGASMLVFGDGGEVLGWRASPETHERICVRPRSGFYLSQGTWCGHQRWFAEHRYDTRAIRCEDYDLLLRDVELQSVRQCPGDPVWLLRRIDRAQGRSCEDDGTPSRP